MQISPKKTIFTVWKMDPGGPTAPYLLSRSRDTNQDPADPDIGSKMGQAGRNKWKLPLLFSLLHLGSEVPMVP